MVVYTNADFISLNEENLTYSVLVEDKGKIAYIGYNTPLCYRDAKVVDLEGKAVLPAVNDPDPGGLQGRRLRRTGCGRKCRTLPSWTKTFSRTLLPRWKPCT